MNMLWALIFLAGGVIILWKSAELLVTGAVDIAERFGISPLVVGLTVVAMGTSAPEVAASIAAAVREIGDVAIGNVFGSNIANLALVGGVCALIRPIKIQRRTLYREIPVMILVALLLYPALHNLYISRIEGAVLFFVFAILLLITALAARRGSETLKHETKFQIRSTQKTVLFVIIGLAGLALGADITVRGAVFIGQRIGLSNAVVGLTIVAVGTSLPELMTSLVAAVKGHHDISIGNLVGSNIFNTLLVTGTAGLVRPFEITSRLAGSDYWIMIGVSILFFAIAIPAKRITRIGASLLLLIYIGYLLYLFGFTPAV